MKKISTSFLALMFLCNSFCSSAADNWQSISEISTFALLGFAVAKPLYDVEGWTDVKSSWHGLAQVGQSVGVTTAISVLGNQVFSDDKTEFSSPYAANAFAAATHLHIRYGWQYGFPAYTLATVVGYGLVESEANAWKDVLIGAAIGAASAWFFTQTKDRAVELIPFATSKEVGLTIAYSW